MFGNLKDFISVVQDGLASNNNLRQKLQEVQKVTKIFKDKQQQQAVSESKVNYGAGGKLLEKYQSEWAELHENSDKNAKAAEEVDILIQELHEATKVRLQTSNEFAQALSHLPNLTASVAQCMDSLKNVQSLLHSVEEELIEFEDLIERSNMEKWKLDHHYQLTLYKEKKMASLEEMRSKLAKENSEQNWELERRQIADLQSRRERSAVEFQQDVVKYLTSGSLPRGSPSQKQSQTLTLEQVTLDDDPTDLEEFLAS